jgi:phosphoribosylglycinamide formyltransferase
LIFENEINQPPPPTDQSILFFTTTDMASLAPEPAPSRLTILISGSGTNLQALIDACSSRLLPSTSIVRVISNRKAAFGLKRAESAGISTTYHNLLAYKKRFKEAEDTATSKPPDALDAADTAARTAYDADLAALVLADTPDLIICAGWMHILTDSFLSPLSIAKIPIVNIHPALPREFDGANAIARAYAAFQEGRIKRTGVMIHYVVRDVDCGEPIVVKEVEMRGEEGLKDLEERIHVVEHELIVRGTGMALARLWEEREKGKDGEGSKNSTRLP